MSEVPAETPVTTPVPEPIVATAEVTLVHVPPEGYELNVVVAPVQTLSDPVIAEGAALTVTVVAAKHPPLSV